MDTQFVWKEEYKIGVDVIDREHQRLFKIINKLFTFKVEKRIGQWACREGIKFFKKHALEHFADEENYMESTHYDGLEQHRGIHQGFRENTLPALEQELVDTEYSPEAIEHFLGVCAGWLIGHTLTEDLSITGKPLRKWDNLLPNEDIGALKKVISRLVFDMFQLEPQLISDAYNGEKFGQGVYYRLIYGKGEEKKKLEIIMIFEEKILVNTVGKVMGIQTNRLDTLLMHAARYAARQFVGRVMESFPALDAYELKEENLLTYEQFEKVVQREKLQVGLLFSTSGGYFSYCVIAPHLLEEGIGIPLEHENVMAEVEEYLAMRQEQQKRDEDKKKVLVVDDSLVVRQSIRELLQEDYEVELAESGISAIREITLNKPDLILLDYEMPVCDGRQTLEMLRSEKAFADLPVIFLTGRGDPESVKKVLALKPAGYLLKNLEPAKIKKNIDSFFEKNTA